MNRIVITLITLAVIAVVGAYFWQTQTVSNPSVTISENEAVIEEAPLNTVMVPSSVDSSSSEAASGGILTESDIRDINQANDKHFASQTFLQSDYFNYDEATLKKMVDSGDVTAMKTLWTKYLKNDDPNDMKEVHELVTKAIVYGDRDMLQFMPELNTQSYRFTNPEALPEQKHQAMINILAYHEFMGMRGYMGYKYTEQQIFFKIHSTPESPIKLSAADKAAILTRAKEIYADYEGERLKLGLGPFDNSVSDGQKKLFEMQRESYLQAMGENAI